MGEARAVGGSGGGAALAGPGRNGLGLAGADPARPRLAAAGGVSRARCERKGIISNAVYKGVDGRGQFVQAAGGQPAV